MIAIVVLELSNNREIGNWKGYFQPSVWLSITSTIGNLSLSVALAQGAVVFFWRKAVKGATVRERGQRLTPISGVPILKFAA